MNLTSLLEEKCCVCGKDCKISITVNDEKRCLDCYGKTIETTEKEEEENNASSH